MPYPSPDGTYTDKYTPSDKVNNLSKEWEKAKKELADAKVDDKPDSPYIQALKLKVSNAEKALADQIDNERKGGRRRKSRKTRRRRHHRKTRRSRK